MANIHIVTGSVMGTAEGVAQSAHKILEQFGHTVFAHETFSVDNFDENAILLVCTSSTGMGDLPENIIPFYHFLLSPDRSLAGMKYGIISLGDSSYPNFAQAGIHLDETLADLGAVRLGDRLIMDAILVEDHQQEASTWIKEWATLL